MRLAKQTDMNEKLRSLIDRMSIKESDLEAELKAVRTELNNRELSHEALATEISFVKSEKGGLLLVVCEIPFMGNLTI